VFGEVAELYDASRPSYPEQLVDDVLGWAPLERGARVLEVGAGTGKATTLFAARGFDVLAIEPSAAMAAVGRRNCAPYPGVEIVEADFELWDSRGERFPLLYSAQAWHWIDPEVGLERAHRALRSGGLLAAFWNRPAWGWSPLRDALIEVYRTVVPDLEPVGPMHPANLSPLDDDDWVAELAGLPQFNDARIVDYHWSVDYTAGHYVAMLGTLSEVRLLETTEREALLRGVHVAIEQHGGVLPMPLVTRLCLARTA
jgi:SAM-dependent methyltransferase